MLSACFCDTDVPTASSDLFNMKACSLLIITEIVTISATCSSVHICQNCT